MEHGTCVKRNRVKVEETGNNEAAENSSDTSMESEHNNNSTVFSFTSQTEKNKLIC